MSQDTFKQAAAAKAVEQIKSGMVVGLGSGSTSRFAVIKIGELWQAGKLTNIVGVPTSASTAALAREYGLPLATLDEQPVLDLAIDGADEVDPQLNLIKGLGGALLREKMVEMAAKRFIVIVDESKLVDRLGTRGPLPVEVAQFGWRTQFRWLASLGCTPTLRGGEAEPYITDNGNYILDCLFPNGIDNPAELAAALRHRVGVVEHGLFLDMADEVIVAGAAGVRQIRL
jgi:ribose 5-phosphate isomerase A